MRYERLDYSKGGLMKSKTCLLVLFLSLVLISCSNNIDEAKRLASSDKFNEAVARLQQIPQSDKQWDEAQSLIKNFTTQRDKQQLTDAIALINNHKTKEALSILHSITNPDLQQEIHNAKLRLAEKMIQGSWRQFPLEYSTRTIRFDEGSFRVVDIDQVYRGSYQVSDIVDNHGLITYLTCQVSYGYQNFTMYLQINFIEETSIHVRGSWSPASNGIYMQVNQ